MINPPPYVWEYIQVECDSKNPEVALASGGGRKGVKMKLLFISSENCGACRKLKGAMEYANMLDLFEIKVINPSDENDFNFIKKYGITTFPTLLLFDDDEEELDRLIGLQPLHKIRDFIPDECYEEDGEYEPDIVKEYIENREVR